MKTFRSWYFTKFFHLGIEVIPSDMRLKRYLLSPKKGELIMLMRWIKYSDRKRERGGKRENETLGIATAYNHFVAPYRAY